MIASGIALSEAINGEKGEAMFRHACQMGLEGIVSKRLASPYVSGRTRHWLKVKNPEFQRPHISGLLFSSDKRVSSHAPS
jgi:bifunctional non-homologous end joining protein LigD